MYIKSSPNIIKTSVSELYKAWNQFNWLLTLKTPIDVELMNWIFNGKPGKINGKQLQFQQCERRKISLNQWYKSKDNIHTNLFRLSLL